MRWSPQRQSINTRGLMKVPPLSALWPRKEPSHSLALEKWIILIIWRASMQSIQMRTRVLAQTAKKKTFNLTSFSFFFFKLRFRNYNMCSHIAVKSVLILNFDLSTFLCCQGNIILLLTSISDADLQVNHTLLFVQTQSGPVTSWQTLIMTLWALIPPFCFGTP